MRTAHVVVLGVAVVVALSGCTAAFLPGTTREAAETTSASSASAVTITGGFETKGVDNGRPVVLVAAALGVPEEVFRLAFSGVTPAVGGQEPQGAQVDLNKQALLKVLGPYGVTNEQLDAASNFYRYSESKGETWTHSDATATLSGNVVTITNPGAGYTSTPKITLPDGRTAIATIGYGKDTKTNGSITSITID